MAPLPLWLVDLLPIIAVVLALLVVVLTVLAIRQLRTAGASPPPAAGAAGVMPGAAVAQPIAGAVRHAAARLAALRGGRRGIDAIPLLVAVGAGSADVQRMVPDLGTGIGDLSRAQQELFRGDCRISVCPDGAVVSFEDGLLTSDRREARWMALVNGLIAARSDRPFDGLMIVLPADQFYGPKKASDDELVLLGEELYQLIWVAQRAGGWRVPIYLVLSGCEILTGFTATAAALSGMPAQMQRGPLGWAVPYALASAFERGWIREGFDALTARLSILQSRLLMRPNDTDVAELLLLFPNAVAALAEPLATLLTPMLRPSAYHEAFMFRGFYLTGRTGADATISRDAFAGRLLADRMFPEHILAQPAQGATTRRQRRIRMAQIALAALAVLALVGIAQIRSQGSAVATARPLITEIAALASQVQAARTTGQIQGTINDAVTSIDALGAAHEPGTAPAETRRLLLLMSGLSVNRLATVWAPLSFLSGAEATVEQAIAAAYQVAVLYEVLESLTDAIPTLLGVTAPGAAAPPRAVAGATCDARSATSGGIERLQQTMKRLGDYDDHLALYQDLTVHPRIENLKSLLQYALAMQLPAGFTTNYGLYETALLRTVAPPLEMGPIRTTIGSILSAQFSGALDAAYPGSPLGLAVNSVVANTGLPAAGTPAIPEFLRLQHLDDALHTIQAQAPLPDYAWLSGGAGAPSITALIDQIAALSSNNGQADIAPVDPSLPLAFRSQAKDCVTVTRQRLLDARVYSDVPVLAVGAGQIQLSPPLQSVMAPLDSFLTQPLATTTAAPVSAQPVAPGDPLYWSTQDLQSLQDLTEAYLLFIAQSLPATVPPGFREQVQAAAGERLDQLVANAISRARQRGIDRRANTQSGGTAALRDEITRFADATPILTNLRTALRESGRSSSAEHLDQLLADQAIRLLRQVDALLTAADPYQLVDRSLAFWSGAPPLAAAAFGAATLPDLVGTLPARRDYIDTLATDYAAPLVAYFQQSGVLLTGANMTVLKRWQGITDTLNSYHRGDPTNSLSRLEQFISADMDRIDLANCAQLAGGATGGSDWFAEQLANIRSAVLGRCSGANYADAASLYSDLAGTFNRDLAGRFPFGDATSPDADPNDVKRFYNRFGTNLAALQTQLAGIASFARSGTAQFVNQLLAVQTVLAPMLSDPAPDAPLTYDTAVDFRTNMGSDPGANQIAELIVLFGQQRLSSFATTKSMAWSSGQPVQVQLRWATNAPSIPATPTSSGCQRPTGAAGTWACCLV